MKPNTPKDDEITRQLLNSAQQAANDLRREQGIFSRLISLLERRSEQKHELQRLAMEQKREDTIAARCQAGKHDTQGWKHVKDTEVFGESMYGVQSKLPIKHRRTWQGHCIHCGAPETRVQDL